MYDIITIGSAAIDVYVKTKCTMISIKQDGHDNELLGYPAGSKILITDLRHSIGGGGTNTAVSFSRLGLKVAYLGKIGKDEQGQHILNKLNKENVDFIGAIGKEHTGYSTVLDSMGHNRTILVFKGANNNLSFKEVDMGKIKCKWLYCTSMVGTSFKTLTKVIKEAKKNKIKVMFNPSSYQAKKGLGFLKEIIKGTNVLIVNKEECEGLLKQKFSDNSLKKLKKAGPEIVIVTNGVKPSYAYDGKYKYTLIANKVRILETTGAGDAFGSTFLAAYIKKKDIKFALKLAQVNAESVIMHYGAKNKLLTWKEALNHLKKRPTKVKKEVMKK